MIPRTLLVDADIIAYQAAAVCEKVVCWNDDLCFPVGHLQDAIQTMDARLESIQDQLKSTEMILALTSGENFRKSILPTYKANRIGKPKPVCLAQCKEYLLANYRTYLRDGLEADDCLGILSTSKTQIKGEKIIISIDKDFRSIPGLFYHLHEREVEVITEAQADRAFMYQTLIGDTVDGYTGCPGIGPKTAEKILGDSTTIPEMWPKVVAAYEKAGFGEEEALVQARVARILRASDYDFKEKKVKLWEPPTTK